ncbi:hypothetical protein KUTeg_003546 [Tegillarca granosa]|uniref:Uncharacterized protein n=1 Tax=Tegillarca granosa TaxID=220873 RepID=A0ABQ9FMH6_TEGGR|nr:hypothetical protein KUTeg_003546 [Tegillarca granosa]
MANKGGDDPISDANSSVGGGGVGGLNKNAPLPEEWTLPHEWNMEKREVFENWKMDVQNQVANIATSLGKSLKDYPHPDLNSQFDYTDEVLKAEIEKHNRIYARFSGPSLNYGLGRMPEREMAEKF